MFVLENVDWYYRTHRSDLPDAEREAALERARGLSEDGNVLMGVAAEIVFGGKDAAEHFCRVLEADRHQSRIAKDAGDRFMDAVSSARSDTL